jgi:hypothetical protein
MVRIARTQGKLVADALSQAITADAEAQAAKRFRIELDGFKVNETQKLNALRKAAQDRLGIEKEYAARVRPLHLALFDVLKNIQQNLTKVYSTEENRRSRNAAEALNDQLQDARESYSRGEIDAKQFNRQLLNIQEERQKLQIDSANEWQQTLDGINAAVAGSLKETMQGFDSFLSESVRKYQDGSDSFLNVLTVAGGQALALTAKLGAEGQNLWKSFQLALVQSMVQTLQAMIPLWVAGWLGVSISETGILGTPLAVAGFVATTALLEAAIAGAASAALNAIQGNARGDIRIEGPGTHTSDSILRRVSRDESIISARGTLARGNEDALRWMNRGNSIFEYAPSGAALCMALPQPELRHDLSRLEVTQNGIRQQSEAAYQLAAAAHATSVGIAGELRGELSGLRAELSIIRAHVGDTADSNRSIARTNRQMADAPTPRSSHFTG